MNCPIKMKKMIPLLALLVLVAAGTAGYFWATGNDGEADLHYVSDADFANKVLEHQGLVVVDLHAEWCRPCHVLKPIIADLADEYAGRVRFAYLDFDKSPETIDELEYELIPTVYIFDNGELVHKKGGLPSPEQLRGTIDFYLNKSRQNDGSSENPGAEAPSGDSQNWDVMHACNPAGFCEEPHG